MKVSLAAPSWAGEDSDLRSHLDLKGVHLEPTPEGNFIYSLFGL